MRKKDILKSIIVILVFILIGAMVILDYISKNKMVDEFYTQEDLDIIDEGLENYMSDKITPKGLSKLYGAYDGDVDINEMYRGLYKFVNYLPTLSKKVKYENDDSIYKFYEKNSADIKENLGMVNEEEFYSFVKYLNKIEYKGQKFIDCKLDSTTFKNGNKYFSYNLTLNFEGLNNEFKINVNFANNLATRPILKYKILGNDIIE